MNKAQIRKKILGFRKKNNIKNLSFNFNKITQILKKKRILGKNVGGYYPYNYEFDIMQIIENFEKKKFSISLPKIRKKFQMDFFKWYRGWKPKRG